LRGATSINKSSGKEAVLQKKKKKKIAPISINQARQNCLQALAREKERKKERNPANQTKTF
jgi:hypothetical protein